MPRPKPETRENSVSLHIASSFPGTWEHFLLPWFRRVSLASLATEEPIAVVTPFPSSAGFFRARLLEDSVFLLGIKFLTPPQLREQLLAESANSLPLREHLRLLLAMAAESVSAENPPDADFNAIAKSISRAPDNLLRAFDQVSAAGWNFDNIGPTATHEIIKRFRNLVRNCGFQMVHEADRDSVKIAASQSPRFNEILMIGFTAAHWPLLPLLQAAALAAKRATIVLEYPREQTRAADEAWIGTWEQIFAPASQITEADGSRPFAAFIQPNLEATNPSSRERVHYLVGLNATEQTQAICAMTVKFLTEKSCTRLGILFPRAGALSRLVSDSLARAGILHHDAIGHLTPGEFEQPLWKAWLDMQENHQLESVLRFLETNPQSLGELPIEQVRRVSRRAYQDILIDDINILAAYCEQHTESENFVKVGKLLLDLEFLPARATLEDFLARTEKIFLGLKWKNRWSEISQFAKNWTDAPANKISRSIYLRWLGEIANSFSITRVANADHPYSRVHLLCYADAEMQEWSHLILAGLNQGEWPETQRESGFLPDEQIAELNARATRPGSQGEGHSVLEPGKTFLIGAQDERRIALRQFAAALESVEHGLAITASLLQEAAPERLWNPSELFSQVYFSTEKAPLSQQTMSILRDQTHAWLLDQNSVQPSSAQDPDIAQTRIAYDQRRKPDVAFGEYEFALRERIGREVTLRATEWDKVVKTPALIWMKKFLGVENDEPDLNQWSVATGTWVHDWLAAIAGSKNKNVFVEFPTPADIGERISHAASSYRKMVADLCQTARRTLPDWWISGWSNAFALVRYLAGSLTEVKGWPHLTTEWHLSSDQTILVNENARLRVRGRIDLILVRKRPNDSQLTGSDLWIIDYKTGNVRSLAVSGRTPELRTANLRKKLIRGDAIQLGLYGLAARELGAGDVDLSILSLRTDLNKPQLKIDALGEFTDFWNELYQMQEDGVFGLRGSIRNEFGYTPDYPLATLPIDKEFLDEKWVLTHSAFADDEEGW